MWCDDGSVVGGIGGGVAVESLKNNHYHHQSFIHFLHLTIHLPAAVYDFFTTSTPHHQPHLKKLICFANIKMCIDLFIRILMRSFRETKHKKYILFTGPSISIILTVKALCILHLHVSQFFLNLKFIWRKYIKKYMDIF